MWTPGMWEMVIIFLIVLLLFGGKKLPSLARSIGSGINEFKKGMSGQAPLEDNYEDSEPEKIEKPKSKSKNRKA